ncbi:hypothetical protein M900_2813 [Bacteriovorax sp. Seq25_V]|nr:hypothetical protein M900_2813 [Bacteriovorax sp. Seq25_V]
MILPVRDSVGGAIGFKVYDLVERYLKASKWCYYQSNSEIINILTNYKNTLDQALNNPEVLKIVSEKTQAGSLIKIKLDSMAKGMNIEVTVLGPNGKDVYFNQVTAIESDEIEVIAQTVNNWLDVYEKNIPYDARVVGVLGTQFTIDLGQQAGIYNGYEINVVRPVKKQRHPLLKEIVEWRTMPIATAKLFHVGQSQAQAKILKYERETLVQVDDWILISKNTADVKNNESLEYGVQIRPDDESSSFGKLGFIAGYLNLGSGSARIDNSSSGKEIGGLNIGVGLAAEIWATRNYWAGLDIDKHFGSHSKKEGTFNSDSNSLSFSKFKLKVGYRYLPLGFFYGPQLDGYIGYGSYTYGYDNKVADGITETVYKGIFLGGKGSMPIIKDVRAHLLIEFMLSPGYEETLKIYGEADTVKSFNLEVGGSYQYSPNTAFVGAMEYISNSAEFENSDTVVKHKNLNFKIGASFNY